MRTYEHPNLGRLPMTNDQHLVAVRLLGVVVECNPMMLVMEFCARGSLLTHLRAYPGKLLTVATRVRYLKEIAQVD